MSPIHNDNTELTIQTAFDRPTLDFDFPNVEIGVAEYPQGPTGCTVLRFPAGAAAAVDIAGGANAVSGNYEWCHAICFAGGALYGLEAAAGVAAELWAKADYAVDAFPLVNGAVIYDFATRPTPNMIYPDKTLGRAAVRTAQAGSFPLGAVGAGRSASNGSIFEDDWSEMSGQGAAFRQVGDVKMLVIVVNNSVGAVHGRDGRLVRGHRPPNSAAHVPVVEELERRIAAKTGGEPRSGNSNLTVIVTNQALGKYELKNLCKQVHTSLARAIHPFHTVDDNDVCYAISTAAVEKGLGVITLGLIAAELAWDALLRCGS